MRKLILLLSTALVAVSLCAQSTGGRGVPGAGTTGGGATLPFPGIVYGTSATGGTVATASQVNTLLQTLTGCTTLGTYYSVQAGGCTTPGGGAVSSLTTNGTSNQATLISGVLNDPVTPNWYPGGYEFGDSITQGQGCTVSANCYASKLSTDLGLTTTNAGINGSFATDMAWLVYADINPGYTQQPNFTGMIGVNEANTDATTTNTNQQTIFTQVLEATEAWATIPRYSKIFAGTDTTRCVQTSGTWTADSTLRTNLGIQSQTQNSVLTCTYTPTGPALYLVVRGINSNGGTASITIDGVAPSSNATIAFTGTSATNFYSQASHTSSPMLYRYPVTANTSHVLVATVTSATSASNVVAIEWVGGPWAASASAANAGPRWYEGGVIKQNTDTLSAVTALYDSLSQTATNVIGADLGGTAQWVNVRNYVNSTTDMSGTAATAPAGPFVGSSTTPCPASTVVGLHPNDCGHQHLRDAFAAAINPGGALTFNGTLPSGPILSVGPNAPATLNAMSTYNSQNLAQNFGGAWVPGLCAYAGGSNAACDTLMTLSNGTSYAFARVLPTSNFFAGVAFASGTSTSQSGASITDLWGPSSSSSTTSHTQSAAGAASTGAFIFTGAPFAGTGTTSTGLLTIDSGATKPTTLNTAGTQFEINAASGYTGDFLHFYVNGSGVTTLSASGTLSTAAGTFSGAVQGATLNGTTSATAALYKSSTNCSSSASPAVCAAAADGSFVVAAAATTVVVNTTAVTANSQILITPDSSLGTKLSVTCNTTIPTYMVTARTAATSFTVTLGAAPTTNPECFSYSIVN